MKENDFQKKLIDQLYSQGAWCFNVHGHKMQKTGVADVLVVHRRWTGFIELKVENKNPSAKQKDVAKDLIKRYFPTFVVRCREMDVDASYLGQGRFALEKNIDLTIEDFQGNMLCRPADLDKVLDCLQALTADSNSVPWVKMPKLFAEGVRDCRAGDKVFFGEKTFLCVEDKR